MTAHKIGQVLPLREPNGAPRHDDEKLLAIVKQAVRAVNEESDRAIVNELRALTKRVVLGYERLSETFEAYVSGEREVAVACMTDSPTDDLPSIARIKADSSLVYTLSATEIAKQTDLRLGDVSYLLSQDGGLDWVHRKPELWNQDIFKKTKRRLWHPTTPALLLEVISESGHPDRAGITEGCRRVLERAASTNEDG